jgi:hypothetical protein
MLAEERHMTGHRHAYRRHDDDQRPDDKVEAVVSTRIVPAEAYFPGAAGISIFSGIGFSAKSGVLAVAMTSITVIAKIIVPAIK